MTTLGDLAARATPGPWRARYGAVYSDAPQPGASAIMVEDGQGFVANWPILAGENHEADAAYVAAVSPDVVLALLDERDALRSALLAVRDGSPCWCSYGEAIGEHAWWCRDAQAALASASAGAGEGQPR